MRSISQCLPLAVLAMLVNACDQPTAPTSTPRALALRTPNASISDAANGGRLGFYFLPSLVTNPGTFDGTFDGTLQPYATICALVSASAGCGDGENLMVFPFGGEKPTGISVDALTQSYGANWSKPTLGLGKYRLSVNVDVTVFGLSRQISIGFMDLQVIAKKKDPVDAGFVGVVKGSPIPFKFRIENGVIGGINFDTVYGEIFLGSEYDISMSVFDLHGQPMSCPDHLTFTSSNTFVVSISPIGVFRPVSVGDATITVTCRGASRTMAVTVPPPVPD